ncbi:FecR domain-containing protein [Erythrobacter sp. SCSIO 43205]|uniref:FecR domain-containing protein n=1 Tax=Erythrobacter sp. SCSIO 43205 TaxID=2779361 RepID=UPI001CA80A67|nr:FecR domain-containing protein [Erythrobacter sp. SCSIO 43205]UAB77660.1 FecR domain-containing protein [Erythrobacter sp. SCSIO 43205]
MALTALVKFAAAGALFGACAALPAHAQAQLGAGDEGTISYTIKAGDTLYSLAGEYFTSRAAIGQVQKLNRISNARAIPVGAVVKVPRALLKSDPVLLNVLFSRGEVSIRQAGAVFEAQSGMAVQPGAIITTGARAFVSLGRNGERTRVSLPSNSRVQIKRARRYRLGNKLDVDLRVLRGRGEITAPKLNDGERFNTGTPLAVTAVRGTEFRVGYEEDSSLALTEVVEGLVEVSAAGAVSNLPAGLGIASDTGGLGDPEELLRAPELVDPNATQTKEQVTFAITPVDGAIAYRTQIAADQTFLDVIAEQVTAEPMVSFEGIEDARLSVRSRAVAASGLEGFETPAQAFRRKRVGASGGLAPSPFADAYKFVWQPDGEGQSYAGFRLWAKDRPDVLLVDEAGLTNEGLYVSNLAPGDYQWQVSTFLILAPEEEGETHEVIKIWSDPVDLPVRE